MSQDDERVGEMAEPPPIPVFFLSDSTGITAETMGNALLIQFPNRRFDRRLIPFISTVEEARLVVANRPSRTPDSARKKVPVHAPASSVPFSWLSRMSSNAACPRTVSMISLGVGS